MSRKSENNLKKPSIIHLIIIQFLYYSPIIVLELSTYHLSNRSKSLWSFLAAFAFSQNECKQSRGIQPSNDVKFCSVRRQHLSKPTFKLLPACAAAEELRNGFYRPESSVKAAQNHFYYCLATMKEGIEGKSYYWRQLNHYALALPANITIRNMDTEEKRTQHRIVRPGKHQM